MLAQRSNLRGEEAVPKQKRRPDPVTQPGCPKRGPGLGGALPDLGQTPTKAGQHF